MTNDTRDPITRFSTAFAERYVIERELGAGGMAIVYLARDVRHERLVALKVVRPELAAAIGAERFLAEIKTTANLQHPHIVPLHESGEVDGVVFYVMPFVEGEGLRDRLNRERQLPVGDALRIATQVASALDYAHRHGVIHRDIKPENILLHDGSAVVADFGIALAVQTAAGARLTQTGLSLGTPQYMSPEQAMGERTLDARSDIYALAAVLYEMLIGEPPFTGPTPQAIVARTLSENPRSLTSQRRAVPPQLEAAVLRALEKLPADRFSTAGEFAAALSTHEPTAPPSGGTGRARWQRKTVALAVAGIALAGGAGFLAGRSRNHVQPALVTSRIGAEAEAPSEFDDIALSPDGQLLAYVSGAAADGGRIWVRRMSTGDARPIKETEGAFQLFWAPDGSAIGFVSAGQMRVATLSSGDVRVLAPAPSPAGAAWGPDGTIIYSPFFRHLWRVPAAGGTPSPALTKGDETTSGSREPKFLPDGHHFLYWRSDRVVDEVWVGDLVTGVARRLAEKMSTPTYVEPGYVLYFPQSVGRTLEQPAPLFVRRFDAGTLTFAGDAVPVSGRIDRPDQVAVYTATRDFLVSRDAVQQLAGAHGAIYWLDRSTGRRSDAVKGTGSAWFFRASHDGRRFALGGAGLSLYDPARDVSADVPARIGVGGWPLAWSPDDREIAANNGTEIMIVSVDGAARERSFTPSDSTWAEPVDWAPDGTLYYLSDPWEGQPRRELWRHTFKTGKNDVVATGSGNVIDARLSPDWRWLAWESDASGRHEIYLGPATGTLTPSRVSKTGGGSPRWRHDGHELFYIGGDGRIMSVPVQLGATPLLGEPRRATDLVIHPDPFSNDPFLDTRFEPSPAGDRFLVQTPVAAGAHQLTMIQGWQRKVPR